MTFFTSCFPLLRLLSWQALFDRSNQYSQYQISFSMSYMELYKDEPYDLLVTRENVRREPWFHFTSILVAKLS